MQYADGRLMMIGDEVAADGMTGLIVCDFDNLQFAEGYEHLKPHPADLTDEGIPSTGVMIKTDEIGLVHYGEGTWGIGYVRSRPI